LEDVVAHDARRARARPEHCRKHAQRRRLARSVGAQQAEDLARPALERDAVHRAHLAAAFVHEALRQVVRTNGDFHQVRSPARPRPSRSRAKRKKLPEYEPTSRSSKARMRRAIQRHTTTDTSSTARTSATSGRLIVPRIASAVMTATFAIGTSASRGVSVWSGVAPSRIGSSASQYTGVIIDCPSLNVRANDARIIIAAAKNSASDVVPSTITGSERSGSANASPAASVSKTVLMSGARVRPTPATLRSPAAVPIVAT